MYIDALNRNIVDDIPPKTPRDHQNFCKGGIEKNVGKTKNDKKRQRYKMLGYI